MSRARLPPALRSSPSGAAARTTPPLATRRRGLAAGLCGALLALAAALGALPAPAAAQDAALNVYGPGGPAPAMQEAARAFAAARGVKVNLVAGPTPKWVEQARQDADVVYSGAEHMMSEFAKALPGAFDLRDVQPLYLRPVAILVRPGNPKRIRAFRDLLAPGVKVLAVAGSGQTGLWEDVAGRTGDIALVRALRRNLVLPEAANSGEAKQQWVQDKAIDAWLVWNIWQVASPDLADAVEMDEPHRIWRDTGVVITARGRDKPQARAFVEFLASPAGRDIFARWGWKAP